MQISADGSMYALALISKSVGLATIGVCVFCAVCFGSRTFLLQKSKSSFFVIYCHFM